MTFTRETDFTFDLYYSDSLKSIAQVSIQGLEKHKEKFKEKKFKIKVKALIELSESGLLNVSNAYALFELDPEPQGALKGIFL